MRAGDVLAIGLGCLMSLASLALQAWTLPWWLLIVAAFYVIGGAVLHMMFGGSVSRIARMTAIALLAIGLPCLSIWYYLNYPASQKVMQAYLPPLFALPKPLPAPLAGARKTEATVSKAYFKCKIREAEFPSEAEFKSYIEAWANAYNFNAPTVNQVPGGLKADVLPKIAYTDPWKRTFQIVKIGKEYVGIYSAEYASIVVASSLMNPNSPLESQVHKAIEGLAKVQPGDCELQ